MKIAIDKRPLISGHKVRGVGVYTKELLRALEQESKRVKELKIKSIDITKADLTKYDLIHYPFFNPYQLTLPLNKPTKMVITIHDLVPLIYPKHYAPGLRGKFKLKLQQYLINKVDGIITPSETSKKDVVRFLGVPAEKIKVIYEAPRKIFCKMEDGRWKMEVRKKYNLPKTFALYVGDVNYNKNIMGLIKACKLAKLNLVICGKQAGDIEQLGLGLDVLKGPKDWFRFLFNVPHPELAHFKGTLNEFQSNKNIFRPGYVPDKDLVAIYNLASVYCQPSFYEGFGLPVLEAMACGVPVVCSKTQALVEIADNAALFADPKNPKEIASKLTEVLKNPTSLKLRGASSRTREHLIKQGLIKAREFSWSKTAKGTIYYYRQLLINEKK